MRTISGSESECLCFGGVVSHAGCMVERLENGVPVKARGKLEAAMISGLMLVQGSEARIDFCSLKGAVFQKRGR